MCKKCDSCGEYTNDLNTVTNSEEHNWHDIGDFEGRFAKVCNSCSSKYISYIAKRNNSIAKSTQRTRKALNKK